MPEKVIMRIKVQPIQVLNYSSLSDYSKHRQKYNLKKCCKLITKLI